MNQTQKRLSIIKLAISIGDTETIQLQILKLTPLQNDYKIQEIIRGLQAENYAQTQALITEYLQRAPEEIHQRISTTDESALSEEEAEEIIEEFDLFKVTPDEKDDTEEILDLGPFTEPIPPSKEQAATDYDSLLNLTSEEVLTDSPDIKQTVSETEDDFFKDHEPIDLTQSVERDDFFNTLDIPTTDQPDLSVQKESTWQEKTDTALEDTAQKRDADTPEEEKNDHMPDIREEALQTYEPIPYIEQKLQNMMAQYPALESPRESYPSVDALLRQIAHEGYRETEIEEMILRIGELSRENKKAEAAQLLLLCASTQSKFAHFMLARSLFKGDLFEQNLPEAFTRIHHLAMDEDYPEAICDLGQLYEYGIGVDKDTHRAEELYKEAMELGISRAKAHYERLSKANKRLLGIFRT